MEARHVLPIWLEHHFSISRMCVGSGTLDKILLCMQGVRTRALARFARPSRGKSDGREKQIAGRGWEMGRMVEDGRGEKPSS